MNREDGVAALPTDMEVPSGLAKELFVAVFISVIEIGEVEVEDRAPSKIVDEALKWMSTHLIGRAAKELDSKIEINLVSDHRATLHEIAQQFTENQPDLAIMLHATGIEHSLNQLIVRARERSGTPIDEASKLPRWSIFEKVNAVWEDLNLPQLDSYTKTSIVDIANHRNGFVHYKWGPGGDSVEARKKLVSDAVTAQKKLDEAYNEFFWNGRQEEIVAHFTERVRSLG